MNGKVSPEEHAVGAQLRMDFAQLKKLVDTKTTDYNFPWDKYYHLLALEDLNIPFGVYSHAQESDFIKNSDYTHPFIKGGVSVSNKVLASLFPNAGLDVSTSPHASTNVRAGTSPLVRKRQEPTPDLESLCKGQGDEQRRTVAKIDAMWESVKNDTHEANYPAACVAVYKLALHFGMLHETKARIWKEILRERYGVTITEGISKYSIGNPPVSKVFRNAVLKAFANAQQTNANLAKRNPLPPVYR